jgi:arylsulfatase A-like enzyme
MDIAPTILSATLDTTIATMEGKNLLSYMTDTNESSKVFLERERHAYVRKENLSYPMRAVRTTNFLYINSLKPDRWPAGDPEAVYAVGEYGDIDSSPTKFFLMDHLNTSTLNREGNLDKIPAEYLAGLSFNKRPSEELYDLNVDPFQLNNIVQDIKYADSLNVLRNHLKEWQVATDDPRLTEKGEEIDTYQYYGNKFLEKREK